MTGILLCAAAFLVAFLAGRRSLASGLSAVLAIGYFYGIVRANFPDPASHFIFDAAVLALYLTRLLGARVAADRQRVRTVPIWTAVLIAWPLVMVFVPLQDPLVQLVGLRGNIFLLPFLMLGARLKADDIGRLALTLAVLNLMAFAFAGAEYAIGMDRFFPHNFNTELIYRSGDVGAANQLRIPGPFSGAHAYAGTMVMSLPFLLGAWAARGTSAAYRVLLIAAMGVAALGIFAAASRVHTIVLATVVIAVFFSGSISANARVLLLAALGALAAIVLSQERLQRFTTLRDTGYVSDRVAGSVNTSFWELLLQYPFGNGLGGGGTSMPYFLQDRLRGQVVLENEYARILLEQSSIGLCLWITFIGWFVTLRFGTTRRDWGLGEHVAWVVCMMYFGTALIGIGMLTAIPQSALMFLCIGWVGAKRPAPSPAITEIYGYAAAAARA